MILLTLNFNVKKLISNGDYMDNSTVLVKSLAKDLLKCLHVSTPSSAQVEVAESFIFSVVIPRSFDMTHPLGKKEMACLYWAAQGKSAEETATLLCISKATVETYRWRIKRKLNCRNMTQAVYEGMKFLPLVDCMNGYQKDQYICGL